MNWQPIETAPKDGTKIMVTSTKFKKQPPINIVWFTKEEWRYNHRDCLDLQWAPTHWMPLPKPPKEI